MRDILGQDCEKIKDKKLFLFDMDGTIYNENELIDGTLELLDTIKNIGGRSVFITNNSSKSVNDYIGKLRTMKIDVGEEDFFTSAQATIVYLKNNFPNKKVYCMGTKSLLEELCRDGIDVTEEVEDNVDVVLVGFDTELTSLKLRKTCELLTRDVAYIATNVDLVCPVSFGFVPDCGAVCEMLAHATGKKPVFIGKPEPTMVEYVMSKFNYSKQKTMVIGDRLYTDIASGVNANVSVACVLSGESSLDDVEKSDIKPTYLFNSVKDIFDILK